MAALDANVFKQRLESVDLLKVEKVANAEDAAVIV